MSFLAEGPSAVCTLEGTCTGVLLLMLRKVCALSVALSTVPANIWTRLGVHPSVPRQIGASPKGPAAVHTGIGTFPAVNPPMGQQVRALPKGLAAFFTFVSLQSCW